MPKSNRPQELATEQIHALLFTVRKVFTFLAELRLNDPLAQYIKDIQIPSELSESIALRLLQRGTFLRQLKEAHFALNPSSKLPDITASLEDKKYSIEAKATGVKQFQRLSEKDIRADYLIWLYFGNFFIDPTQKTIDIYILPKPGTYFKKEQLIQLNAFLKAGGKGVQRLVYDLSTLS